MGRASAVLAVVAVAVLAACRSAAPPPPMADMAVAIERLQRPLPGEMSAFYRLRVPSSGGLRLTVLSTPEGGRISVSEPFGSALSLTAWGRDGAARLFDLKEGCQVTAVDLGSVLKVGHLPLPQAVRLLAGRLPAGPGDVVDILAPGQLRVGGADWACRVSLLSDPWRVTRVEELAPGADSWWAELEDHSGSFPGVVRLKHPEGRWAELELARLQWDTVGALPPLPELPPCAESDGR
jgi:hypothetical protein